MIGLLLSCSLAAHGGETKKNQRLYFEWGYNKDWFSKSTLTFQGTGNADFPYSFTVYDVAAHDEFRGDKAVTEPFVSQYSYRIGWLFNASKGLGIEFNYDHAKYVLTKGQRAHVKGIINEHEFDNDTVIDEPFLLFEHTNGANFTMINFVKEKTLHTSANGKFSFVHTMKTGAGVVIPKTYILLDGKELDNDFHVAGWVAGVETGVKTFYKSHFYVNLAAKACYADYRNALGLGQGKVSHHFWAYEALLTFGWQISL